MSISVTISGEDSISVVSSTPLANTLEISSNVVLNSLNVATGVLNTATGALREDISSVSGLITSNDSDISSLQTSTGLLSVATGNLDAKIITVSGLITSNDSEITALNSATGALNTNVIGLQTATGSLKSDISSNDSDISSLQNATGSLKSDISSNDTDISALQTVTGLLKTSTGNLDSKIITVSGLITSNDSDITSLNTATGTLNTNIIGLQNATGSLKSDISSNDSSISALQTATGSLKSDISSNDSDISALQTATGLLSTATGNLDFKIITVSGLITSNDTEINALNTATGVLNTATGTLNANISSLQTATGVLDASVSSLQSATGALSTATGNLDSKIITVSGLINSNDSEITALNSATGALNTNVIGLQTATGSLKSDISSNDSDISTLQTVTGLLKTATGNLDAKIITVSGLISSNDAELAALNTATGALTTATGNLDSKIITVSGLITSNDTDLASLNTSTGVLNTNVIGLQTATGSLKSDISSNDSDIASLQTATGSLKSDISSNDTDISALQTATGLILSSGEINTNINTAIANLVDSAPGTLNTLNELAAALGDDANFSTTTASSLGNLSTATGVLNTNVLALQAVSGSFARTGSSTFGLLNVTGNVGIGTTSPLHKLAIGGNGIHTLKSTVAITDTTNGASLTLRGKAPTIFFDSTSAGIPTILMDGRGIEFKDGTLDSQGNVDVKINADGNVGIGTTSPAAKLHVSGTTLLSGKAVVRNGNFGLNTGDPKATLHIKQRAAADTGGIRITEHNDDNTWSIWANDSSSLFFQHATTSDGSPTSKMFLTSSGLLNVKGDLSLSENDSVFTNKGTSQQTGNAIFHGNIGIGTTSPSEALDVNGNILSNGVIKAFNSTSNTAQLEVGRDGNQYLEMRVSDPECFIVANQDSDSNGTHRFVLDRVFAGSGPNDFEIRKGGTAQVTVDTDGNVGIGTASPSDKFVVSDGTNINFKVGALSHQTVSNMGVGATFSRTSSDAALTAIGVSDTDKLSLMSRNGLRFLVGGAIDYRYTTEVARFDNTGNLGIGTTSPAAKLHVDGNTILSGNLDISGSIVPAKDVTFDIGSPTKRFKDLYLSGDSIFLGDTKLFVSGNEVQTLRNGVLKRPPLRDAPARFSDLNITGQATITGNLVVNSNSLVVDVSEGKVGVGTSAPSAELHVDGDTILSGALVVTGNINSPSITSLNTATGSLKSDISSNDSDISALQSVTGSFAQTGSSTFGLLNVTGNVGVGTNIPAAKLDVNGYVRAEYGNYLGYKNADVFDYDGSVSTYYWIKVGNVSSSSYSTKLTVEVNTFGDNNYPRNQSFTVTAQTYGTSNVNLSVFKNYGGGYNDTIEAKVDSNLDLWVKKQIRWSHNFLIKPIVIDGGAIFNEDYTGTNRVATEPSGGTPIIQNDRFVRFAQSDLTTVTHEYSDQHFRVDGSSKLTILGSNGNVGIGTTSPQGHLDINTENAEATEVFINGEASQSKYLKIRQYEASEAGLANNLVYIASKVTGVGVLGSISAAGAETDALHWDESGRVGIGTTSPASAKLHVLGDNNDPGLRIQRGNSTAQNLYFKGYQMYNAGNNLLISASDGNQLRLGHVSSENELIINSAGNVGIGTASPATKLEVNGDIGIGRVAGGYTFREVVGGNERASMKSNSANDLIFSAGGAAEKMRITSAGNVGIGTTSPDSTLHLSSSGPTILTIEADTDNVTETDNARIVLKQDGGAVIGRIGFENNTNALEVINQYADSLSLGTSNSKRLLIDSNGNVGIGTTSPSAKLEVNGHFAATTKSFIIDNPEKGGRLQYGVVETDEHSVYVRGKSDQEEVELPEEWDWLVHEDSVTVQLTSVGQIQQLFVVEQNNKKIKIGGLVNGGQYNYVVYGTRKDVDPLEKHLK